MLIKAAGVGGVGGGIEYQMNYGLPLFPPNALNDSDFKDRRTAAVGEASSEVLVKRFVISPNYLFTRSHTNHIDPMKSKWNLRNMWDMWICVDLLQMQQRTA